MGSSLKLSKKRLGPMEPEDQQTKRAKLCRALQELDMLLAGLEEEQREAAEASRTAEAADTAARSSRTPRKACSDIKVIVGTSQLAQDLAIVNRILHMVNRAYSEANKDLMAPGEQYQRLSLRDVLGRLEMGDAGARANRVLHIAHRGEAPTAESIVGCMSSTIQPPWTEEGCGHWGLVVVDVDCQGQGVASAMIAEAERRLAGACDEIQIEYEYTPGQAHSERLMSWYEGRCGFECRTGYRRGPGTQFRKCRKPIPPELARAGKIARLKAIRAEVAEELHLAHGKSEGTPSTSHGDSPGIEAEESSSCASPC